MLADSFGRIAIDLRVPVTDRCDPLLRRGLAGIVAAAAARRPEIALTTNDRARSAGRETFLVDNGPHKVA